MLPNRSYEALFSLLRAGLWEREIDTCSLFPLSEEEWIQVFKLARQQTICGIVSCGMKYLLDEWLPSPYQTACWAAEVDHIDRSNQFMNEVVADLFDKARRFGLHPLLQKGAAAARLYENPMLRQSGDVDLYFSPKEFATARQCVATLGCSLQNLPDGSCVYTYDHVKIEHHRRLFDLQHPIRYRNLLLRSSASELMSLPNSSVLIDIPSPETQLLLFNSHILKHVIGRGIGLRQICDIARAYYCYKDKIDGRSVRALYMTAGLEKWTLQLHRLLIDYIGLEANYLPYEAELCVPSEPLLKIILRGGNFGQYISNKPCPNPFRRKVQTVSQFLHNSRYAMEQAPAESFWGMLHLAIGQLR